jgi:hypothetical protein
VRSLHQPSQLVSRNQGHVARAAPADDNDFAVVHYLVENRTKSVAQTGVGCLYSQNDFLNAYGTGSYN